MYSSKQKKVISDDYKYHMFLWRIPNEAVRAHLRLCPLPQSITAPG